jgi:ABC-type Fe3+-hydroxamate transport system substrate-binding protein
MRVRNFLLTFMLIFALVGCGEEKVTFGGKPRTKEEYYRTFVSLSPSTTELFSKANLPSLAGRTSSCNFPEVVLGARVVGGVKPDYEALAEVKPDLVLMDKALYSDAEIQKVETTTKARTLVMDVNTVEQLIEFLYEMGSAMAAETPMSDYADKIFTAREVATKAAGDKMPRTLILMPDSTGGYMIAGKNCFTADMVRASGADVQGPEDKKFVAANLEKIVDWNPDKIIVAGSADVVLKDARLASVPAVKNRKVAAMNPDTLLRAGSRVDLVIGRLSVFLREGK